MVIKLSHIKSLIIATAMQKIGLGSSGRKCRSGGHAGQSFFVDFGRF